MSNRLGDDEIQDLARAVVVKFGLGELEESASVRRWKLAAVVVGFAAAVRRLTSRRRGDAGPAGLEDHGPDPGQGPGPAGKPALLRPPDSSGSAAVALLEPGTGPEAATRAVGDRKPGAHPPIANDPGQAQFGRPQ